METIQYLSGDWKAVQEHATRRKHGFIQAMNSEGAVCEMADPEQIPVFQKAFTLVLAGRSFRYIRAWLAQHNIVSGSGTPLTPSRVRAIFRDPLFCGIGTWYGKPCLSGTEIVSPELFGKVQAELKRRSNSSAYRPKYSYMEHVTDYGAFVAELARKAERDRVGLYEALPWERKHMY